jgi:hypothetical protein
MPMCLRTTHPGNLMAPGGLFIGARPVATMAHWLSRRFVQAITQNTPIEVPKLPVSCMVRRDYHSSQAFASYHRFVMRHVIASQRGTALRQTYKSCLLYIGQMQRQC